MKNLRPFGQFTGIQLNHNTDKKTMPLSTDLDLCKTLYHFGMSDCKPALSLIVANTNLTRNPEDANDEELI